MFHRKFPDRWLSWQLLAKIYAKAGIKKKAVVIKKVPQKKTYRFDEFDEQTLELSGVIDRLLSEEVHLVFADEAIFNARGFQLRAWAKPNSNVLVSDRSGN